jgi:hypothetical protein
VSPPVLLVQRIAYIAILQWTCATSRQALSAFVKT